MVGSELVAVSRGHRDKRLGKSVLIIIKFDSEGEMSVRKQRVYYKSGTRKDYY